MIRARERERLNNSDQMTYCNTIRFNYEDIFIKLFISDI